MRFFVIIAACVGIATAVPTGFASSDASASSSAQSAVRILPTPLVYEDKVGGDSQSKGGYRPGAQPGYGGGAGSQATATANAGAGVYQPVARPGFGGGYQAGSQATATANAGAGVYQPVARPGFGGGYQTGSQATASGTAGVLGTSAVATAETKVTYAAPIIEKNFYYHVAPEDTRVEAGANTLTITPRKHYKVIFIKAPSVSAEADSSAKAASETEEKTIVYVLVNNKVKARGDSNATADSFVSGKPEVFFVKYQGKDATARAVADAKSGVSFADANAQAGAGAGGSFAKAGAEAGAGYNGDFGRQGSFANAGANAGAAALGGGPAYTGGLATAGANAGASSGNFF